MKQYPIPAAFVQHFFTGDRTIYRIKADKSLAELHNLEGGKLSTRLKGQRILAIDIAWALKFGNWPKFPLVQLSDDLFDCRVLHNVYPARLKQLRHRQTTKDGKFYHPLSKIGFSTPEQCRTDWIGHARDYYAEDARYVLAVEAEERELRRSSLPDEPLPTSATRKAVTARLDLSTTKIKPPRPAPQAGHEHHWFQGEWVTVPVACHVADDYAIRCKAFREGAVRAAFHPDYQNVWYYKADGAVVHV